MLYSTNIINISILNISIAELYSLNIRILIINSLNKSISSINAFNISFPIEKPLAKAVLVLTSFALNNSNYVQTQKQLE